MSDSSVGDEYSTDTDAYDDDDFVADDNSVATIDTLKSLGLGCDEVPPVRYRPAGAGESELSTALGAQPKASLAQPLPCAQDAKGSEEKKRCTTPTGDREAASSPRYYAEAKASISSPAGSSRYQHESEEKADEPMPRNQHTSNQGESPNKVPESKPYISVKGIELSEVEAKYLYGIKKSEENPSKIVIVHQEDEQPKKIVPKFSLKRMEELAKPRDITPTIAKYATEKELAEQKRAARRKRPRKGSFLERMEHVEKQRRDKIERRTLELKYEARASKKLCPNCGGEQSFDEFEEDRLTCPSEECGGQFQYKSRRFVLKKFEKRMQRSIQRRCDNMEKIVAEQDLSRERGKGKKSRKQKELLSKVERSGKSFLDRMRDDVDKRKIKTGKLEEELQEQVEKECPFKPQLNISDRLLRGRAPRDDLLFAEPKHRKTNDRSQKSSITRRGAKACHSRKPRQAPMSKKARPSRVHPPIGVPKRRMAAQKEKLPDSKAVAKKFKRLLL